MPTAAEQKTAFVERPLRAQVTNAPYGVGSGQAGASGHFEHYAAPEQARATLSGLQRPFRAPLRSRASGLERQQALLRFRGGLEQPFRAPLRHRAGSSGHFERHCGAERAGSSGSRFNCCSEAGSSSHFERHCGTERARATISSATAEPSERARAAAAS